MKGVLDAVGRLKVSDPAVSGHVLLDGVVHTDTVADAVTKGSLIVGNSTPKWDELGVGANNQILMADSAQALGLKWGHRGYDYIQLEDRKSSGSHGGTFTLGAWRTRVLNTEVIDTGGNCTLSGNQFTLTAGTYIIYASAPALWVQSHKTRLYNVSDGTVIAHGTSGYTTNTDYVSTRSFVAGRFTIASTKTFRLEHRCTVTRTTNGLGTSSGLATEVYAQVQLWKE
ncbi:hypothetical protein ACFLXQ_01455 [Chloroflexota bacterium]